MADRPRGVAALAVFFGVGAVIAATSCVSLLFPGSALEPMWRLNPRARDAFARMGPLAVALLATVAVACALSSFGLWRGARWGHRLALVVLAVNLLGDITNLVLGVEPRAAFGVPIVAALLVFLASTPVRALFGGRARE